MSPLPPVPPHRKSPSRQAESGSVSQSWRGLVVKFGRKINQQLIRESIRALRQAVRAQEGQYCVMPLSKMYRINTIPLNQMQSTRCVDNSRNFTWPQSKSGLLKGSLHITLSKISQVSALSGAAAVGLGDGQVAKRGLAALDTRLVALDNLAGFVFGSSDLSLLVGEKATSAQVPSYTADRCQCILSLFTIREKPRVQAVRREHRAITSLPDYLSRMFSQYITQEIPHTSFQLDGRLDSLCLTSRCAARILPSFSA